MTQAIDLLIEVRDACLFEDEDGRVFRAKKARIDNDLFLRICECINGKKPKCPICNVEFKPEDICAYEITEGTCHADCLKGSAVVNIDTGDPQPEGKIGSYPYSDVMDTPIIAGSIVRLKTGTLWMTVERINEGIVDCVWFDETNTLFRGSYLSSLLIVGIESDFRQGASKLEAGIREAITYAKDTLSLEEARDKIEGLSADLDDAVNVAFQRGAVDWVRMNYPAHYATLSATPLEAE